MQPPRFEEPIALRPNPQTTVGVFLQQARRLAIRPVAHHYRDGSWQDVSWIEMQENALRIATGLVAAGVDAGDRVVLLSENRVEWLTCDLGIQMAGAVTVPIHPSARAYVTQAIATRSGAILAIASGEAQAAKLHLSDTLGRIVRLDGEVARWSRSAYERHPYEEVCRRVSRLGPDDVATVIFSSDITGRTRGVVLTHRSFVEMAESCLQAFEIGQADSQLSLLSHAHVIERMHGLFVAVAAGATVWLSRGVDLLAEDLQVARPTVMIGSRGALEKIRGRVREEERRRSRLRRAIVAWAVDAGRERALDHGSGLPLRLRHWLADRLVLSALRRRIGGGRLRFCKCVGTPLEREVEEFFWAVGVPVYQGWGLTETTSEATSNRKGAHRLGTVGTPLPGVEVGLTDDGEISVRGPGVMRGYDGDPAGTAEVLQSGWLKTGVAGTLDEAGYLSTTDRKA